MTHNTAGDDLMNELIKLGAFTKQELNNYYEDKGTLGSLGTERRAKESITEQSEQSEQNDSQTVRSTSNNKSHA